MAPWADVLYFADSDWWEQHRTREAYQKFVGNKVTIAPTGLRVGDPDVFMLRNAGPGADEAPLELSGDGVMTGYNGGFQALNFAVQAGAAVVVLLGFDMKQGPGGRNNWHNEHRTRTSASVYADFLRPFRRLPPLLAQLGVQVLNATPDSALKVFPKVALESVLPDPEPAGLPA